MRRCFKWNVIAPNKSVISMVTTLLQILFLEQNNLQNLQFGHWAVVKNKPE